jgi:hypothetical protein
VNRETILSGKAGLAGIQWALKSRPARELLRQEVRNMLNPAYRPGPFQLTRAKYKPARKLSAYYTFIATNPGSLEKKITPLAVTWEEQFKPIPQSDPLLQMEQEVRERGLAVPYRKLWSEIPDWGVRLQIWPLDKKFPQLARLADQNHVPHTFHEAGIPQDDCLSITPIRYRPGERHVLRYTIGSPKSKQSIRIYAKLYENTQDAARAYGIACKVVDWLAENSAEFHGVRPAGMHSADAVIFYPHAPGTPLSHLLDQPSSWLAQQMQITGAALSTLHHGPSSLSIDLETDTLEDEIRGIRRASEHVQVLLPETAALILRTLEQVQELHARLEQEKPTFTHSDFKADHLLVTPNSLTLIDFDTCALADPALDLGKFMADLDWWFGTGQKTGVELAQEAFLRGYFHKIDEARLARARLYQVLILIKITLRRARLYEKDWAALTARMITYASTLLEKNG